MPAIYNQSGIEIQDYIGWRPNVKMWGAKGDMYHSYFGWFTTAGSSTVSWWNANGLMNTVGGAAITAGETATVTVNVNPGPGNRFWVNQGQPNAEVITAITIAGMGLPTITVTAVFANAHAATEPITTAIFAPGDVGKMLGVPGAGSASGGQAPTSGLPGGGVFPVATGALQVIHSFSTAAIGLGYDLTGANSPTSSWRYCFQVYGSPVQWGVWGSNDSGYSGEVPVYDSANSSAYGSGLATCNNIDSGAANGFNQKVVFQCVGPAFKYYRLKALATVAPASMKLYLIAHGNTHYQAITAYQDPLHVTVAAPAAYTVLPGASGAYGYFGTDDTAAINLATNSLVASYTDGATYYASAELYFPPGQYMVTGPMFCDRCRWLGSHTDTTIRVAPGALNLPTYMSSGSLPGAPIPWQPLIFLGHAVNAPAAQTQTPKVGSNWAGNYPSFGSRIQDLTIYLNEMPCVGVMCETTQEHSGLRNVDIGAWTGLYVHPNGTATWCDTPTRAAVQIGFGCINNGWDDLGGGAGYSNIPHPQLQLLGAITSTGAQTVNVNRTDFLTVGMALDVGHCTTALETVVITAIGTGTITATFAQLHPAGDSLLMTNMPVGLDFIVVTRASVNNCTIVPSQWPGWGFGIRAVGSIMTIEDVHGEQGLYVVYCAGGSMVTIRLLQVQETTYGAAAYGAVQYQHEIFPLRVSAGCFTTGRTISAWWAFSMRSAWRALRA